MNNKFIYRILTTSILFVAIPTMADVRDEKIHQLNRDIVLLNLVNGLFLTPEQMESIIDKIDSAEQARKSFWDELNRRDREVENVLKDVRKVLFKGEEISDELKKRVHRMKEIQQELEDLTGKTLQRLESKVESILTPNQCIVIEEYRPCTIPPAQGKIGQSVETAAEGIAHQLTKIRDMSSNRFDTVKDMFIDFHIDKIKRHLGMDPQEETVIRRQLLSTFEEVRSMDDQEFLVRKGEIARSLMPEDTIPKDKRKNKLGKTGRFLLDPAMKDILQEKIKRS